MAFITDTGEWSSVPCDSYHPKGCELFGRRYLARAHDYTVVSWDGKGDTLHSAPTQLSECYDYSGKGTYSAAPIERAAIAASSNEFFMMGQPMRRLHGSEAAFVTKSLSRLVPERISSKNGIHYFSFKLEGKDMDIVQRTYEDSNDLNFIFAIGTVQRHHFNVLHWKKEAQEEEQVLGTISLKNGREFLITMEQDSEGHSYRVYGIHEGQLQIVYSGGGASC